MAAHFDLFFVTVKISPTAENDGAAIPPPLFFLHYVLLYQLLKLTSAFIFQIFYSLVSKIEIYLKYFLDKNSQKQP